MLTDPETKVNETVVDIDLTPTRKKKFRVDGEDGRILELNTSDLGIFTRFEDAYPKLDALAVKAMADVKDEDDTSAWIQKLREIDKDMRELIDYIFDSNVSEVCAPYGSMYDPFNGKLRYEHIIEVIGGLYENNFKAELKNMKKRVSSHTSKYTKKKKK